MQCNAGELVEPTEDERANGWTAETLTAYLCEREQQQAEFKPRKPTPGTAEGTYDVLGW